MRGVILGSPAGERPREYGLAGSAHAPRSLAAPEAGRSGVFLGLLPGAPRWGGVCQAVKGSRGAEDLRGAESGRRNLSPRDADCGHHVSRRHQSRPSASLTAVTRPPGRAPQSARRPAPAPFCLPEANQESGRAGVPPLHAALGAGSGRISLRMTPPPFGAFCPTPARSRPWAEPSGLRSEVTCWAWADREAGWPGKSFGNPCPPTGPTLLPFPTTYKWFHLI